MIDQSPAAFARPRSADPEEFHNPETYHAQEGMTLRDYFAAKAMASLITEADDDMRGWLDDHGEGISSVKALALASYYIADVMLVERTK